MKLQGNQLACVLGCTAPRCGPCPGTHCPCHLLPIPVHTVPTQTFTCHVLSHVTYRPPVHTAPAAILLQGPGQYINCSYHCLGSGTQGLALISTPTPRPLRMRCVSCAVETSEVSCNPSAASAAGGGGGPHPASWRSRALPTLPPWLLSLSCPHPPLLSLTRPSSHVSGRQYPPHSFNKCLVSVELRALCT